MDSLLSAVFKDVLLRSVMQKFVEFESPLLFLIIDDALAFVFRHCHSHSLFKSIQQLDNVVINGVLTFVF